VKELSLYIKGCNFDPDLAKCQNCDYQAEYFKFYDETHWLELHKWKNCVITINSLHIIITAQTIQLDKRWYYLLSNFCGNMGTTGKRRYQWPAHLCWCGLALCPVHEHTCSSHSWKVEAVCCAITLLLNKINRTIFRSLWAVNIPYHSLQDLDKRAELIRRGCQCEAELLFDQACRRPTWCLRETWVPRTPWWWPML